MEHSIDKGEERVSALVGESLGRRLGSGLFHLFVVLMSFGFIGLSNVPKCVLLTSYGANSQATVVSRRVAHYASFPYSGTINTAEFRTPSGTLHQFEFNGERLPNDSTDAFGVTYLEAWPGLVMIDAEPGLSYLFLFFGLLVAAMFVIMLSFAYEDQSSKPLLLRPLILLGDWMLAGMELAWNRAGFDQGE